MSLMIQFHFFLKMILQRLIHFDTGKNLADTFVSIEWFLGKARNAINSGLIYISVKTYLIVGILEFSYLNEKYLKLLWKKIATVFLNTDDI